MTYLVQTFKRGAGIAISLAVLSGCAINMSIPITEPAPSTLAYNKGAALAPLSLAFKDEQSDADKAKLVTGTIPMNPQVNGQAFNSVNWLAEQTVKEMIARGLPVALAAQGGAGATVVVKRVHIENYRANGFSPFVTFTSVRADVDTPQGPRRVTAWVKRAKVPVMSFNEIIDPAFNAPLSVLTKELAAKLNQQFFKQAISDAEVNRLIASIKQNAATADTWLDVYQLGFGNNPSAVPELVKLATHSSEYVRLAAISSLGILKAQEQMPFLVSLYEAPPGGIWQDRAMALKAIGDLDTAESRAYLKKQQERFASQTDKEATWSKEIIALYL